MNIPCPHCKEITCRYQGIGRYTCLFCAKTFCLDHEANAVQRLIHRRHFIEIDYDYVEPKKASRWCWWSLRLHRAVAWAGPTEKIIPQWSKHCLLPTEMRELVQLMEHRNAYSGLLP